MSKYYYLVSQLPFLKFGKGKSVQRGFFLREAKKWLSPRDFFLLSRVDIDDFSVQLGAPAVWRRYREFESDLRKDISFLRRRPADYAAVPSPVKAAVSGGNPLEAETKLLKLRWDFIDEEQAGHHFDLSFLILYFLKIQILEILNTFNKDKGMAVFDRVCEVHL